MSVVYANYPIGSDESVELGIMENGTLKDGQGYHIRINKPYEFLDNLRCIILEEEILIKAPNVYSNTKKHIRSLIKKAFNMTFPSTDMSIVFEIDRGVSPTSGGTPSMSRETASMSHETPSTSSETASMSRETASTSSETASTSSETASMSRETASMSRETPSMSRETASTSSETASMSRETASMSHEAPLTSSEAPLTSSETPLIYNLTPSRPLNYSVMDNINNVISNCINSFPQSHWDTLPVNISRTKIHSMKRHDLLLAIRETAEYHNITIPLNAINNLTLPHIKNTLRIMLRYK
jgi:hypothetical protein